jgi:hypothetical protein
MLVSLMVYLKTMWLTENNRNNYYTNALHIGLCNNDHIVTCRVVRVSKITGSSLDDLIY